VSRVRYQASFILDDYSETKGAPYGLSDYMLCRKSQDEHWLRSSHEFDNCSSATTPLCLCAVFNAYPDHNMNSILKWTIRALGGSRLPLVRVKPAIVSSETKVEEERLLGYGPRNYYPARLGQIMYGRYLILIKLRFGAHSTVWLAQDLLYVPFHQRSNRKWPKGD